MALYWLIPVDLYLLFHYNAVPTLLYNFCLLVNLRFILIRSDLWLIIFSSFLFFISFLQYLFSMYTKKWDKKLLMWRSCLSIHLHVSALVLFNSILWNWCQGLGKFISGLLIPHNPFRVFTLKKEAAYSSKMVVSYVQDFKHLESTCTPKWNT